MEDTGYYQEDQRYSNYQEAPRYDNYSYQDKPKSPWGTLIIGIILIVVVVGGLIIFMVVYVNNQTASELGSVPTYATSYNPAQTKDGDIANNQTLDPNTDFYLRLDTGKTCTTYDANNQGYVKNDCFYYIGLGGVANNLTFLKLVGYDNRQKFHFDTQGHLIHSDTNQLVDYASGAPFLTNTSSKTWTYSNGKIIDSTGVYQISAPYDTIGTSIFCLEMFPYKTWKRQIA